MREEGAGLLRRYCCDSCEREAEVRGHDYWWAQSMKACNPDVPNQGHKRLEYEPRNGSASRFGWGVVCGSFAVALDARPGYCGRHRDLYPDHLGGPESMGAQRVWTGYLALLIVMLLMVFPLCFAKYERPMVSVWHSRTLQYHQYLSDRDINRRKEACYNDIDNGLWGRGCRTPMIARENCLLRCVSTACYSTIYGEDPLEEGEVDIKRGREFRSCARREIQDEKRGKEQT